MKHQSRKAKLAQIGFISSPRPARQTPGFVYILSNESFPGLLKVGMTGIHPEDRCRSVSQPMPTPCKVEYFVRVWNKSTVEGNAHYLLDEHWVRGEWFRVSLDAAIAAVDKAASPSAIYTIMAEMKRRTPCSPVSSESYP